MSLTAERAAIAYRRHHRLRRTPALRRLVAETRLAPAAFVLPVFVDARIDAPTPISSLPGHSRWPVSRVAELGERAARAGIGGLLLFGLPREKDDRGENAADPLGPVPAALRVLRARVPDLALVADVCLCEYTTHGHCGVVQKDDGQLDNDATLENLGRLALSYARAGADIVAPSGMLDGFVGFLREGLDEENFDRVAILSYAAKYASAYYGPFRAAADSTPAFGDRHGYQMDPANVREAMREVALDVEEGADIVMVKPALAYLDVIQRVRERFDLPVAAYAVSGEYAMIKAAAAAGMIDEERAMWETHLAIVRAGASIVLTYFAKDLARRMR